MSELTKQQLTVENNSSFPNNNTGYITPTLLRTFNQDMIDSMVVKGTISESDKKLMLFTDDIDEAMQYIQAYVKKNYTVKPRKRLWWLFEKV